MRIKPCKLTDKSAPRDEDAPIDDEEPEIEDSLEQNTSQEEPKAPKKQSTEVQPGLFDEE